MFNVNVFNIYEMKNERCFIELKKKLCMRPI